MQRRQVLALVLPTFSGCLSPASSTTSTRTLSEAETESAPDSPLRIDTWVDTETDPMEIPYSAIHVEALAVLGNRRDFRNFFSVYS